MTEQQSEYLIKTLEEAAKNVNKIMSLLQGNPIDRNDNGMIGDVQNLNSRVNKLERFKTKGIWLIIGLSIGAGWGFGDMLIKFFT